MKKLFLIIVVSLISFNSVLAIPPDFIGTGGCVFSSMFSSISIFYDCSAETFIYYIASIDVRDPYKWAYIPGSDPNYPSSGPMNFFTNILAPFIALGIVTYGFMANINIFGRRHNWINIVMTFLMVLSIFPTGVFEEIILYNVLRFGSRWAFALWVILFVAGTWSLFRKNLYSVAGQASMEQEKWDAVKGLSREIKDLSAKRKDLLTTMSDPTTLADKVEKLKVAIAQIDSRIDKLRGQQRDLKDT